MYQLTNSLPYLLNRLGVRMGALFTQKIAAFGLTLPMYRVMASLLERPDQKLGELADVASAEPSTMSRLIGSMTDMKLVTRERLPGNERAVCINLTAKGQELAGQLVLEAQHYEDVAISHMPPGEVAKLKAVLGEMFKTLDILEEELVRPTGGRS
ncbi:MarR family winged helix-turn-helix transcriptional regulator [Sphingomonas sp. SRS2]|uniref:MarR family winged helix-turn-helix transcriptional regulator n=1 Tax=Sphingomonas sp. SRS2 TaxID=133190 RepID=UPI0006184E10|nr:MarR family winged helix-turn-helix transcriptional regulator [Sphingomonas sp. SRS2]KKC23998.1 MarR family transcriptional regulator [Sphingomonas sp. SRS2]